MAAATPRGRGHHPVHPEKLTGLRRPDVAYLLFTGWTYLVTASDGAGGSPWPRSVEKQ